MAAVLLTSVLHKLTGCIIAITRCMGAALAVPGGVHESGGGQRASNSSFVIGAMTMQAAEEAAGGQQPVHRLNLHHQAAPASTEATLGSIVSNCLVQDNMNSVT